MIATPLTVFRKHRTRKLWWTLSLYLIEMLDNVDHGKGVIHVCISRKHAKDSLVAEFHRWIGNKFAENCFQVSQNENEISQFDLAVLKNYQIVPFATAKARHTAIFTQNHSPTWILESWHVEALWTFFRIISLHVSLHRCFHSEIRYLHSEINIKSVWLPPLLQRTVREKIVS